MRFIALLAIGLLVGSACSPATQAADASDAVGPSDAGADGVQDTAASDAPAVDAALDVGRDVPAATDTVSDDASADVVTADVVIDPGMCGLSVRMCLCGCGSSAPCQQGCIGASFDCQVCVYGAATACCPGEEMVLGRCIDRFMCRDDACIAANCAAEQRAFEVCFAREQATTPTCQAEMRMCLGSDYPMIRCVM